MTLVRRSFCALLLAGVPCSGLAAERPTLSAPHTTSAIHVDGVLDETAWRDAPSADAFVLMSPREGQAPDESTSVRVLQDSDRLVLGIWCQAKRAPHASLASRDQVLDGDHISVHLDTYGDGQRAYIFGVNPYGVELDGILTTEPDFKWDGVWDAAAHRADGHWSAEIAIPFRILRISANGRPWRLWVRREITSWNEVATWPLYRVGEPGRVMLQAADLDGLASARGGRELSVEPYVFGASLGERPLASGGGASEWTRESANEAGADLQAAVTPSLVFNGTYNPDFSQIEADALVIDVNRRFAIIYPEKRPFFLEGTDHFQSLMDLVETRRMADPQWGTKLTGRAGRWNTGALVVRDGGGSTLLGSGYSPGDDHALTRPGWFALGRLQLPFGEGSNVGVLSGAHAQDSPDALPAGLPAENGTLNGFGGLDAQLRLSEHWRSELQLVGSATRIDSAYASRSNEQFQDWMGVWRLLYRDKARELHMGSRHVGEHFRDEIGIQNFVGVTYRRIGGAWDLFPKGGPLQRTGPVVDALLVHDHTGRLEFTELQNTVDFEFRRSAFVNAGYWHFDEHWLNRTYPQDMVHFFAQWTAWRPLALDLEANVGDGVRFGSTDATSSLAWVENYTFNATARPNPRVTVAANVVRYRLAERHDGQDYFALWLVGVKATAQFTRRLSVRIYPQYDSNAEHLDVNALLGYVVHPGTVFYAGVNSGWDQDGVGGPHRATSRQFFTKVSWRFAR